MTNPFETTLPTTQLAIYERLGGVHPLMIRPLLPDPLPPSPWFPVVEFSNHQGIDYFEIMLPSLQEIHRHAPVWRLILQEYTKRSEILSYIDNGVDVYPFLHFPNSHSCLGFETFITTTILEGVKNGSLTVIGKVGEVVPPHPVMPLTIEPLLCHDERFLNLGVMDSPFSLDSLTDLPRYVGLNHYQTILDDKSGYDHVFLTERSRTFFGFQWQDWYFCYNTILFGWKASACFNHTIGLASSSYIRSHGVPCSQCIYDRHIAQLCT